MRVDAARTRLCDGVAWPMVALERAVDAAKRRKRRAGLRRQRGSIRTDCSVSVTTSTYEYSFSSDAVAVSHCNCSVAALHLRDDQRRTSHDQRMTSVGCIRMQRRPDGHSLSVYLWEFWFTPELRRIHRMITDVNLRTLYIFFLTERWVSGLNQSA